METLQANGVTYEVLTAKTAQEVRQDGRVNTARTMDKNGVSLEITARRPGGKAIFTFSQFQNGGFSKVVRVA